MGAYENPDVAIDTQSGQHIRNMISSLSGTAINVIKEFKAKEKEHNKKLGEFQTEMLRSTHKETASIVKDPIFNAEGLVSGLKSSLVTHSVDAVSGDLTKSRIARDTIQTKQTQGKKTIEGAAMELPQYIEPIKKSAEVSPGMAGAMYTGAPEWYKNLAYGLNYNNGQEATANYIKKEDGSVDLTDATIDYKITPTKGEAFTKSLTLSNIRTLNKNFPDGEYTIPKMKDEDFIKSLPNVFNIDKNGEIKDGVSEIALKNTKYVKEGKAAMGQYAKGDKSKKTTSAGDYVTDTLDRDALAADPEVMKVSSSFIGGMIKSNPRGLAMYANDVLLQKFPGAFEKIEDIDDVNAISAVKDKIALAYTKSMIYQKLPNPTVIRKDAAGKPVYIENVVEKVEGGGGEDNNTTKLTPAQKRDVAFVQDRWKEVKNGHGEYPLNEAGTILYKEDKLYKVIKDPTIPNSIPKLVPLPNSLKKYYGLIK